jgi:predicted nucleic acid-binding protein
VIIISDTSVITNLAAIQHLHLLPQLYSQVIIPEAVYRELAEIDPPVPGALEVQTAPWLEVRQVINPVFVKHLQVEVRLDPGESEAIALALELNADLLLIDERRGRAEASRLGIKITGLLGLLVESKRKNLIVAVKPLMDALIATSEFRISPALYRQVLDVVNEI